MFKIVEAEHGTVQRMPDRMFGYFSWPSVTKMDDGTLIAVASGYRIAHICPFGKSVMTTSRDNGKTWSPLIIVGDTLIDDRDSGIINLGNGRLLLTWFSYDFRRTMPIYSKKSMNTDEYKISTCYLDYLTMKDFDMYLGSFIRLSDNNGATWEQPFKIPVTTPHGPVILNDGNLLYLGKEYKGMNSELDGKIMAYWSCDKGRTWELIGTVPIPDDTGLVCFHEPHALQLPSGKIIGLIRYQHMEQYNKYSPFSIFSTSSEDGGKTWSIAKPTGVEGSPPHLIMHSSGALVCVYGRRKYPFGEMAMISFDNGETWEKDFVLRDDGIDSDLGYPCSVELSDGRIFTVYYQKVPGDRKCSILWTRWRLPGLT